LDWFKRESEFVSRFRWPLTLVALLLSGTGLVPVRIGGDFERDVRVDAHALLVLAQIRNFHALLGLYIRFLVF